MVGIVIVSHSKELAESVVSFCRMMAKTAPMAACGGLDDGSFGTSYEKISAGVESVLSDDGVAVLVDLGSAVMTTEMVLEDIGNDKVILVDCPLVEGALAASIASETGGDLERVKSEAESAKALVKI